MAYLLLCLDVDAEGLVPLDEGAADVAGQAGRIVHTYE